MRNYFCDFFSSKLEAIPKLLLFPFNFGQQGALPDNGSHEGLRPHKTPLLTPYWGDAGEAKMLCLEKGSISLAPPETSS